MAEPEGNGKTATNGSVEDVAPPPKDALSRALPLNIKAFCAALLLTGLLKLIAPGDWKLFWPLMVWSIALLVHFLIVKTRETDDEWVEARTEHILDNASDLSHIDDIRERYQDKFPKAAKDVEDGR